MTDKEKRAIEMFYGVKEPIRLRYLENNKYYNYIAVQVGDLVYLKYVKNGQPYYHYIEHVDLDPPKTAYDELVEIEEKADDDYFNRIKNELKAFLVKYKSQLKEMIEVKE
jgi:hypothetical protein